LDNFREADAEVALHAHLLDGVTIDTSSCDGAPASSTFATEHVVLFGHSMGATIAPTAAAIEPRYDALILSGAGGSWIANVVYKQSPLHVRPVAEAAVGYASLGRTLTEADPALSMVQWAGEATDPAVHGAELLDRDVLMFQGIVDTYILPPIANPLSLAMQLDLAGQELADPRTDAFRTFSSLAPLVGSERITLPAGDNQGDRTRVVVQHREDGVEDGHEVVFQLATPKDQYRCFLVDRSTSCP
jgi:pimeloyl-ACP methyl ester carboxylesterase